MVKNIVAAVISLCVCLGVLEIGLRVYDLANGRSFFTSTRIVPYRTFGSRVYDSTGGDLRLRSHYGETYPFAKPPGTMRIVTFGGSTSVNAAVFAAYGIHYPGRLEEHLNSRADGRKFEVISVANEGYATTHSLTLLAFDVLSWDPDIVVLSHNTNDLHASYFPGFVPDYSNKYANPYYSLSWLRHTCMSLRLCRTIRSRIEKTGLVVYPVRRKSYGPEPAALAQQVFTRNLESFTLLAKSRGIDVILGSQPLKDLTAAEFDADLGVKSYNGEVLYPLHEEFVSHHRRFNQIIKATAERLGTGYAGNAEDFAGERAYFLDMVHYSKAGVERLARNYEEVIISRIGADPGMNVSGLNSPETQAE